MKATFFAVLSIAVLVLFCAVPADAQLFKRKKQDNVWPCQDQQGLSYTTLTVVITVKPNYNMTWKFQEANGVVPNLYITVTLSETNNGTQQDSAYSEVTGLGKVGVLFRENSGPAPYTSWRDAVDHVSTNMLNWFQNGWHTNAP